jgi:cardiolipin synthase
MGVSFFVDWAVLLVDLLVVVPLSFHVLLNKRDPRSAALWLVLLWLVPVGGFLMYWAFGVNRVARRARRRMRVASGGEEAAVEPGLPPALRPLKGLGDCVAGRPLTLGNRAKPLRNGDQAYPAMLEAIAQAQVSLGFCTYIFDHDLVGERFLEALCEAARRGVDVRLLVDGIGAWGLGPEVRARLTAEGGQVATFWPRGRWLKHPGLNLRNHRKILVADGRLAFTGGLNVSARHAAWREDTGRRWRWRRPASEDLHFRLEGPVVRHLSEAFADDWELATGQALRGADWFPALTPDGDVLARGITAGPDLDLGRIYELLLGALRAASATVDLMTPYFIPDRAILAALRIAGQSGVRVRLLLPRKADHRFMSWAAHAYLGELMDCGVQVREVTRGFVHSKLVVVDGHWVLLGSANLDARSFRLNFEFNVEAWSAPLANEVTEYFDGYWDNAREVTPATLRREPPLVQLRNQAVKLFSPYL